MPTMLAYLAFDDTDTIDSDIGTGRLMRNFCYGLPEHFTMKGVLRHQLPRFKDIPFTSNNSAACALIELQDQDAVSELTELATSYLLDHFIEGSDPGLCVALADEVRQELVDFGMTATGAIVSQQQAMKAVNGFTLRGLGGTNDGLIGAAAAVGLSKYGWCGRFIEYGRLRELKDPVHVSDLIQLGIQVVSVDRDPTVPLPGDVVHTNGWIRPSLWGGSPVLQVKREDDAWRAAHGKKRKKPEKGAHKH